MLTTKDEGGREGGGEGGGGGEKKEEEEEEREKKEEEKILKTGRENDLSHVRNIRLMADFPTEASKARGSKMANSSVGLFLSIYKPRTSYSVKVSLRN